MCQKAFPFGRMKAAENIKNMLITRFSSSALSLKFFAISGAAMLTALDIKRHQKRESVVAMSMFFIDLCVFFSVHYFFHHSFQNLHVSR